MGIKAVLPSLDDVAEEVRGLYKEVDGKFVADIEGLDDHPTVRGVITANKANKEKRDALKAEVDKLTERLSGIPEDFDPDSYAEMVERLEKGSGPDVDERLAKQRAKLEERYNAERRSLEEQNNGLRSSIERMVVDSGFASAMDKANVDPQHKAKLLPYLKSLGKISIDEEGGSYSATVETDLGPVSLSQFVTDWAASEDGKPYIAKSTGPRARGGDGRGGTSTLSRADFEALSHTQRAAAVKEGVKIVD